MSKEDEPSLLDEPDDSIIQRAQLDSRHISAVYLNRVLQ